METIINGVWPGREGCDGPIEINLHFHHRILDHNADSVNKRTNTYTWVIHPEDEEREFNITISGQDFFNNNYWVMIVIAIVVIGLGFVGYKLFLKYKQKQKKDKKEIPQFPF